MFSGKECPTRMKVSIPTCYVDEKLIPCKTVCSGSYWLPNPPHFVSGGTGDNCFLSQGVPLQRQLVPAVISGGDSGEKTASFKGSCAAWSDRG